jgi:hypothetical protein
LAYTKLSCFWKTPTVAVEYRAAVSLHSHTNHSKESLAFIPEFLEEWPVLHWALERQYKRSDVPVDLAKAYWMPPLTPKAAFEVERNQIQNRVGVAALVSLTDHDNIEAPKLLQTVQETRAIPLALEWTLPFRKGIFHLGIHNLPNGTAPATVQELVACAHTNSGKNLGQLLATLNELPGVLVIFNHPLWDLCGLGGPCYQDVLNQFLQENVRFLHAFELNATRGWKENGAVMQLAERWQRVVVSGGDRHGCEPSGAVNLTRAQSFPEFVHEIRQEQRSHILLMPQYAESRCLRNLQTLLDVIREYPDYPAGLQLWDDRVFYPDHTNIDKPVSSYWNSPPAFLELIFSIIRLSENTVVRQALKSILRDAFSPSSEIAYEITT